MVLGQNMVTVGAGMLAGVIGSIVVARSVSTMLFGVQVSDPVTFLAVAAVLAAVAVIASYVPGTGRPRWMPPSLCGTNKLNATSARPHKGWRLANFTKEADGLPDAIGAR
jgi:hypothetical protein